MGTSAGRWVEDPILPELKPPPIDRIRVTGARLLHVVNIDARNTASRGGYTKTVALAWARTADGQAAALLAWLSAWQESGHTTGKGRIGWCRILEDRTRAVVPYPPTDAGDDWFGEHVWSQFAAAIREACETLPTGLRERAAVPHPWPGPVANRVEPVKIDENALD